MAIMEFVECSELSCTRASTCLRWGDRWAEPVCHEHVFAAAVELVAIQHHHWCTPGCEDGCGIEETLEYKFPDSAKVRIYGEHDD